MTIYLNVAERRLSPIERMVWYGDETCPLNFCMYVTLRGPLTEQCLREALSKAQARHPLLRMRLSQEGNEAWLRTGGVGAMQLRALEVPIEKVTEVLENEVHTRLDWRQGPLARCVWLRHAPERGTLLLTFHHVIGDGISGSYLVRDVLRALAGEQLATLPLADSLEGHLPARARGWSGFVGYLRLAARMIVWQVKRGNPRGLPRETKAAYSERSACLYRLEFDSAFAEALTARARAEGTTVHGVLSAAIVLASHAEWPAADAHVMFGSPINMRERFQPSIGEDIGFFVAIGASSHHIDAKRELWELARELKQGLVASIELDMPFFGFTALAPLLMLVYRLAGGGERGARAVATGWGKPMPDGLALTNIGRVNVETHYGALEAASMGFVASLSVMSASGWTAASHGGSLSLNSIVMEPVVSRTTQIRVAERVRELLGRAAAKPNASHGQVVLPGGVESQM